VAVWGGVLAAMTFSAYRHDKQGLAALELIKSDLSPGELTSSKKLEERIQPFAPLTKAGEHRKVTSLASKALWCCYPNDVPMFDNNAQRALQIFSRLCRIFPEPGQEEYGCFVDAWLQLYHKIEPVIDQADIKGFPYKIRVLDGILWYMGKPTFDLQSNNMRE